MKNNAIHILKAIIMLRTIEYPKMWKSLIKEVFFDKQLGYIILYLTGFVSNAMTNYSFSFTLLNSNKFKPLGMKFFT